MRSALAVVSAVVLVVTGYGWVALRDLGAGMNTSEVTADAGADGATDILLVGKDSRTDAQGNPLPQEVLDKLQAGDNEASLTDTLLLLHIPHDRSRAVAYSIPRDTYVSLPDGYGQHKINSAYARAQSEAEQDLQQQA
ncbi:LCP family protein [Salinifilum ghardaiensis]